MYTNICVGLGEFESYPNRNSNQYLQIYNIPNARGMIRGTYRYRGAVLLVTNNNIK